MVHRRVLPFLIPFLLTFSIQADQDPQTQASARLSLVVVEGNDYINNIKQRSARDTIVEVQDENHRPVAGAAVSFLLPDTGAGGTFANGSRSVSLLTNSNGRAVMPRLTPNQVTGNFQIRVSANFQGQNASTTISQSNVLKTAAHVGPLSAKVFAVLVGAAAAGAVAGTVVALGGGKPSGTITVAPPAGGTGSAFGPPR